MMGGIGLVVLLVVNVKDVGGVGVVMRRMMRICWLGKMVLCD